MFNLGNFGQMAEHVKEALERVEEAVQVVRALESAVNAHSEKLDALMARIEQGAQIGAAVAQIATAEKEVE